MEIFKNKLGHFPLGIWVALIALILIFLAWIMQAYSLIDWEGAVNLGLQNESFTGDAAERVVADVERGIAMADIVWVLPLTIVAFIGLLRSKFIGFVAAMMVFAVCVYFPLFYAFRESMDFNIVLTAIVLWAIPSLLGMIGLYSNRKIFSI